MHSTTLGVMSDSYKYITNYDIDWKTNELKNTRSLNIVTSVAIALSEALRQNSKIKI